MCPIVPTFTCGFVRSNFSFAMIASLSYRIPKLFNQVPRLRSGFRLRSPARRYRSSLTPATGSTLKRSINTGKLMAQLGRNSLQPLQVKLAHLGLVGHGQGQVQLLGGTDLGKTLVDQRFIQNAVELADVDALALQTAQKLLSPRRREHLIDRGAQLLELAFLLDRNRRLLKTHVQNPPIWN